MLRLLRIVCLAILMLPAFSGCSQPQASHPLDQELARSSVQKAMQAWVDGKTPTDLKPEIVVGDTDWEQGTKLVSFEVLTDKETTDGSNLYIHVRRKFPAAESEAIYVVGTFPVVTIFPQ